METIEVTPVQWMDKAVNALYLELPDDIARDVSDKWRSAKEYLQSESAWAVWKQKAEGLAKALEEVRQIDKAWSAINNIATKALEQFK